jgi:hypothetical protein
LLARDGDFAEEILTREWQRQGRTPLDHAILYASDHKDILDGHGAEAHVPRVSNSFLSVRT